MFVYCNGFWAGFSEETDGVHFGVFKHILERVFNTSITVSSSINECDILLESYFSESVFHLKSWSYSIFFSGESLPNYTVASNPYTIILGTCALTENVVPFPLILAYDLCKPYSSSTISIIPPKDICAVISSDVYTQKSDRRQLIDALIKNGVHIDMGGKYKNNIGEVIKGNYFSNEIIDYYKQYKIVLAFENTVADHYITEKISNVFRANTIPLYFGSNIITKYINHNRIVQIQYDTIDQSITEINKLLTDSNYWLEKANQSIWLTPTDIQITNIVNMMKSIILKKKYNVELICNLCLETERKYVPSIMQFFNIDASYYIWNKNTKYHPYFNKLDITLNTAQKSLALNHILLLEQNCHLNKYVVVLESDAIPLVSLSECNEQILKIMNTMDKNNIDIVFLGKGCFPAVDTDAFTISGQYRDCKVDIDFKNIIPIDNLYETRGSRCTEAYIISPTGIKAFLEYFYNNASHDPIDWLFNMYFYKNPTIKSCWLIPELFMQEVHVSTVTY